MRVRRPKYSLLLLLSFTKSVLGLSAESRPCVVSMGLGSSDFSDENSCCRSDGAGGML